jgi:hypothetical protein
MTPKQIKFRQLTPGQIMDGQRLLRAIQTRTRASLMNNTKWKKLFAGFAEGRVPHVPVTTKYLRDESAYGPSNECWSELLAVGGFNGIEWMDLHHESSRYLGQVAGYRITNHREELLRHLIVNRIPFVESGKTFRITGYLRATASPSAQ